MTHKRFGALSSSVDPSKLALTVQGAINMTAGFLVTLGVLTAGDSTTILDNVNVLVAQAAIIIPAGYTAWGSVQTIAGVIRKIVVARTVS